jgi:hypothetical protein
MNITIRDEYAATARTTCKLKSLSSYSGLIGGIGKDLSNKKKDTTQIR